MPKISKEQKEYIFQLLRAYYHREGKNVRPQTIIVYQNKITRIYKLLNIEDIKQTNFLQDFEKMKKFLEENYKNTKSRGVYLASLVIWMRANQFSKEIIDKYSLYLTQLELENEKKQEKKIKKQLKITLREVKNINKKYENDIKKINFEELTMKDRQLLQNYILFLFYSGIYDFPPPRNNLWNLYVVNESPKKFSKNYTYLDLEYTPKMIYTDFKTIKTHGIVIVGVPSKLINIVKKYKDYITLDGFLFKNLNTNKFYPKNSFLRKIKESFEGKATINDLRHLYLTTRFKHLKPILKQLIRTTNDMMNTDTTALKYYIHEQIREIEETETIKIKIKNKKN
jgi:hypothetical protein